MMALYLFALFCIAVMVSSGDFQRVWNVRVFKVPLLLVVVYHLHWTIQLVLVPVLLYRSLYFHFWSAYYYYRGHRFGSYVRYMVHIMRVNQWRFSSLLFCFLYSIGNHERWEFTQIVHLAAARGMSLYVSLRLLLTPWYPAQLRRQISANLREFITDTFDDIIRGCIYSFADYLRPAFALDSHIGLVIHGVIDLFETETIASIVNQFLHDRVLISPPLVNMAFHYRTQEYRLMLIDLFSLFSHVGLAIKFMLFPSLAPILLDMCPVCLEADIRAVTVLPCLHMFCAACVRRLQARTCPLCRAPY